LSIPNFIKEEIVQLEVKEVNLETLGGGAVGELFAEELGKVLANIADPNADPKAVREVTIKFRIKPSEDRSRADVQIIPTHKLAPLKPFGTAISIVTDGTKQIAYADRPLRQPELPLANRKVIDMEGRKA
jgi:hypothetical protein